MSKTIKVVSVAVVALVLTYFGYDLLRDWLYPCEGIFQQSAVGLNTKLDVIKAKGEFAIGRQKIQDLAERSQETALNLKTCCIVLGKASGDFLRCKEGFDRYDAEIKKVTAVVADAQAARQEGKTEVVDQKIAEAKESVKAAEASAEKFEKQVAEIQGTGKRADGGREEKAAASDCCRIVANAELKSLGRVVVKFPEGSQAGGTYSAIFKGDDRKNRIADKHGGIGADLIPGQYDVEISGRRVPGVAVHAGHDTKIRVGVLRVQAGSGTYVQVFQRVGKDRLVDFHGSKDVGLPIGEYDVEVAGQRAPIIIKEDTITDF